MTKIQNDIDFSQNQHKKWNLIGQPVNNEMGFDGVPVLPILGGEEKWNTLISHEITLFLVF